MTGPGSREVGPTGRAIGIDLLDEMVERARAHADEAGVGGWTEFRRVLRPGGRLCVADLTVEEDLPPEILTSDAAWAG